MIPRTIRDHLTYRSGELVQFLNANYYLMEPSTMQIFAKVPAAALCGIRGKDRLSQVASLLHEVRYPE
jgi:hypothetical protein